MTYQQAKDILAFNAEQDGDPTAEIVEATDVMVKQANLNRVSKQYLADTDWIASKYIDEVVIKATMTDADFKIKYAAILEKRDLSRKSII